MKNSFNDMTSKPAAQFFSYAVPSIIGMLLISGIVIVDGLFIGNTIGKTGLAAVNLTLPVLYLFLGITIMIGVGGSVKMGHALGAGNQDMANRHFSSTVALAAVLIIAAMIPCIVFFDLLLAKLNTDPLLYRPLSTYLGTILWFYPAMMINIVFSIFIRAAGKPGLSLFFGLAGNSLNVILDYVMIVRLEMGLSGAALASGISVMIPLYCGLVYFHSGRTMPSFTRFSWAWREVVQTLYNGSSEMIGQLSIGITTWVFNTVLLSRLGVDGVAAYTVAGYITFVQMMVITGFATGLAPIVGYSFGAGETGHIRRIMKIALISGFAAGFLCWLIVCLGALPITRFFIPGNDRVLTLAANGFFIFASAFLFNGFNLLISAYFTAIGNAAISGLIALMRGVLLINLFVLTLPGIMGESGIWLSYPLAELVTLALSLFFFKRSCNSLERIQA